VVREGAGYGAARSMNLREIPVPLKVVLGAEALTVLAAFLPWESVLGVSAPGIRGDGAVTLVLAAAGGALILANRVGRDFSLVAEFLLGAAVVVVAVYHVNDPSGSFGIYVTLSAGLVWVAALIWWGLSVRPHAAESERSGDGRDSA
jgi:hypothetical protein